MKVLNKDSFKKFKKRLSGWFAKYYQRILGFGLLAFLFLLLPSGNIYYNPPVPGVPISSDIPLSLPSPPPYPVNITGLSPEPLTSEGVVVVDLPSGGVIYQKNSDTRLAPASTTKIMTALVSLDKYALDDVVTVKTVVTEGSTMGLVRGEKITVESLLYGALVQSANDAAYALAENYPGGVQKFVEAMNEKLKELHLKSTHFANPMGFEDKNHYTTPYDLAHIAAFALKNKTFAKIVGVPQITVSDVNYTTFHNLKNVNQLLGRVSGVYGVKSGYTEEAGECLVTVVKRGDREILIVLLRSSDRFGETERIINWVFDNYRWENILNLLPVVPTVSLFSVPSATISGIKSR
ncbi:MAG: hypothetical protein UT63_C0017G0014 [Candidatus Gottesmanbacteria bacterium GW2011_GWC2_39_8]|uniref:Peptidase S11 D-alanyl-D-alanine carboxypeptidase A N-terminal domain-containing protein n=1 Tax=Candidatus Gottesmanbacteria bacterium GW2011_GWC2_39_8 TaxID=1618450 RepID=A0A0G0PZS2_9BACT|nr:MAG: hypothetical protein UT63_C0017G0014 [Candidatus Gottesmanbacteria bacterium GW2011_GWC2_39_8]